MILIFALRSRENDSHFRFTIGCKNVHAEQLTIGCKNVHAEQFTIGCKNVHIEQFALFLAVWHFLGPAKFSGHYCVVGYGQLSN
jgi:hypothetical protein